MMFNDVLHKMLNGQALTPEEQEIYDRDAKSIYEVKKSSLFYDLEGARSTYVYKKDEDLEPEEIEFLKKFTASFRERAGKISTQAELDTAYGWLKPESNPDLFKPYLHTTIIQDYHQFLGEAAGRLIEQKQQAELAEDEKNRVANDVLRKLIVGEKVTAEEKAQADTHFPHDGKVLDLEKCEQELSLIVAPLAFNRYTNKVEAPSCFGVSKHMTPVDSPPPDFYVIPTKIIPLPISYGRNKKFLKFLHILESRAYDNKNAICKMASAEMMKVIGVCRQTLHRWIRILEHHKFLNKWTLKASYNRQAGKLTQVRFFKMNRVVYQQAIGGKSRKGRSWQGGDISKVYTTLMKLPDLIRNIPTIALEGLGLISYEIEMEYEKWAALRDDGDPLALMILGKRFDGDRYDSLNGKPFITPVQSRSIMDMNLVFEM